MIFGTNLNAEGILAYRSGSLCGYMPVTYKTFVNRIVHLYACLWIIFVIVIANMVLLDYAMSKNGTISSIECEHGKNLCVYTIEFKHTKTIQKNAIDDVIVGSHTYEPISDLDTVEITDSYLGYVVGDHVTVYQTYVNVFAFKPRNDKYELMYYFDISIVAGLVFTITMLLLDMLSICIIKRTLRNVHYNDQQIIDWV
jgi:hypothetical protein